MGDLYLPRTIVLTSSVKRRRRRQRLETKFLQSLLRLVQPFLRFLLRSIGLRLYLSSLFRCSLLGSLCLFLRVSCFFGRSLLGSISLLLGSISLRRSGFSLLLLLLAALAFFEPQLCRCSLVFLSFSSLRFGFRLCSLFRFRLGLLFSRSFGFLCGLCLGFLCRLRFGLLFAAALAFFSASALASFRPWLSLPPLAWLSSSRQLLRQSPLPFQIPLSTEGLHF